MQPAVAFHHALADETRWRIVALVRRRALCVCELADILGMPPSSVSSHLQVIRRAGLLESERCEKWVYYRVRRPLLSLLEFLHRHLPATPGADRILARDADRALKRLNLREKSCCPGPKALASRTPRLLSAPR